MLSAAGIGSGLDVDNIVSQLMSFERRPLDKVQSQISGIDAKVSAFGQLKSALSTFQTAMQELSTPLSLKAFTASSENDDVFTASAGNTAAASTYEVEVARLAERHKFASGEFLDTATFGGGAGDALSIQVGTDIADTLTVDLGGAQTLGQIRDAINTATGNPGVTATIISGNNGNQELILTARETGAASALTLSYAGSLSAATFNFQEVNAIAGDTSLLDAQVSIDGYTVTRSTNTLNDVIQGVTLDLHSATPGVSFTLDLARDTEAVAGSVQGFADAYNDIRSAIDSLRSNGLASDSSLLSIEQGLRGIINTPAAGLPSGLSYLAEIGLRFSREGVMAVDTAEVEAALDNDFNAVSELFATDGQGFANRMDTLVDGWLDVDGLIDGRTEGLGDQKRLLQSREESLEYRMEQIENNLFAQFSRLDTLLGSLQANSEFLTNQLGLLPGFTSNNG